VTIRRAEPEDSDVLVDVWLRSVRATHAFLTEQDIVSLLPIVRDVALAELELWVLCGGDGRIMGFLGLSGKKVEALFLDPAHHRRGGGRMLLDHARRLKGSPLSVDVNEQNPGAVQFYRACGFEVVGRSELDEAGRPFPLLHLREPAPRPDPAGGHGGCSRPER
jgi:putative acetyltransferase